MENEKKSEALYNAANVELHRIEDATIAVRTFGQGPAILLVHGYPVSGYTWRKLLPTLSANFTCYVVDLPGLGDSDWEPNTDFSFTAQARRLSLLSKELKLGTFSIIAHDTGATIARLFAISFPKNIKKLVMLNTEIPGHRPPWIQFFQFIAKLPLASTMFRLPLRSSFFLQSSMGFGQFYSDSRLFKNRGNLAPYVDPLIGSPRRLLGSLNYLKGIDWKAVDGFGEGHAKIRADVLFLWGEDDKTFPIHLAMEMCQQFKCNVDFMPLLSASLMPHEEKPRDVLQHLIPFLTDQY